MATLPIMLNGVELSAFSPAPFSAEFNNPEEVLVLFGKSN